MIQEIRIEKLKIHPKNVRKEYDGIEELAQSIKENGIMQNLTVVPDPEDEGKYFVVIGNRRLTAARLAGIDTAPCVVVEEMSDKEQVTTMLTENMNRRDLKIYEEAAAIQMCFSDFGLGMEEMEQKTGLSKTTINHRLNVARLDEKLLQKKANDESFQMSLTDLYVLEKVENIKTRNKILKEARDSRELANLARQAANKELQDKTEKEIIALCKSKGIEPAPKEIENHLWSGAWTRVAEYRLLDKAPKVLKTGKTKEKLFYYSRYGTFYILYKTVNEKGKPTEREILEKEKKKRQKEIGAKYRQMFADMGDFIRNIFSGKIEPVKDETELDRRIWELLICDSSWIGINDVTQTILGKDLWDKNVTQEDRDAAGEKAKKLPVIHQKLAVAFWKLKDLKLTEWDGTYCESSGTKLTLLYGILQMYGYKWEDEECSLIMTGDHELYERKK